SRRASPGSPDAVLGHELTGDATRRMASVVGNAKRRPTDYDAVSIRKASKDSAARVLLPSCVSSCSRTASRKRSQSLAKVFRTFAESEPRVSTAIGAPATAGILSFFLYLAVHWSTYLSNSFTSDRKPTSSYREYVLATIWSTSVRGMLPS